MAAPGTNHAAAQHGLADNWVVKRGFRHLPDHKIRRDKRYFRLGRDWVERFLRLNQPVPIRSSEIF